MHRVATRHDLSLCKQEHNEPLRSYLRRFFNVRATIANIVDTDVIDCFHNGIATQGLYRDFGQSRLKMVVELRDMMQRWADEEE